MRTKSFTRDERKVMVLTWFAVRIQNDNEQGATLNAIARGLNMSPSTHLADILWELVQEKKLDWREITKPGRWTGREYRLMPGMYEAPKRRVIPVKARGIVLEQLELFK